MFSQMLAASGDAGKHSLSKLPFRRAIELRMNSCVLKRVSVLRAKRRNIAELRRSLLDRALFRQI